MRILYCNKYNFSFSGTEVYLFDVMKMMRERGHETALFAMGDARGPRTAFDQYMLPPVDFKREHGMLEKVHLAAHAVYSRQARQRIRHLIREFQPDVAHVRNIYHHLSPSVLWELKTSGIPVLYHVNDFKLLCPSYNLVADQEVCERCSGGRYWHMPLQHCYAGPRGASLVLAAEAYLQKWLGAYEKCVDRFLAPTQFVKAKLVEHGWPAGKIDVLYHFQGLAQNLEAPAENAPVLYMGRLSREKGVADLLRAMRLLPGMTLKIAGDGPQRAELESLAGALGLRNVTFVGHVPAEQISAHIADARFTVFPSHAYETLGKAILESYAGGRAVIASDLGSRRELVAPGRTGILYPAGDSEKLAEAMAFLGAEPAVARRMGEAGRELLRARHSPESHYEALQSLYRQMQRSRTATRAPHASRPARPVRVAFIGGRGVVSKYSGIEAYYEEVGAQLAAMGHQVTVYCRSYFTPALDSYKGMKLVRLPTIRSKHLETLVHTALSTLHTLFSGCEIVHYHALGPALFSFLPRMFAKKTVVTVQGLDWQRKKWSRFASSVLKLGELAALRLPNQTMVVSRTLQQHYRDSYGSETLYVPNGTRILRRRSTTYLPEWGLEPQRYVLFLGRFSPEKNCDLLVEAFQEVDTAMKLVLAGGSSHTDVYAALLRGHQSDRIRFLDWLSGDPLEELLANAALFVLPSDLEGLSLALLDAMGAGVCVLASDIPENLELIDGAGFAFRRGDVADLRRMLQRLLDDPQLRAEAAAAARRRIEDEYLWPGIAGQIEACYLRLLKRRHSGSGTVNSPAGQDEATVSRQAA